jgi:hypothetical protein
MFPVIIGVAVRPMKSSASAAAKFMTSVAPVGRIMVSFPLPATHPVGCI